MIKRFKKQIVSITCFIFMFICNISPALAEIELKENWVDIKSYTFTEMPLTSTMNMKNMEVLGEKISEVKCVVDINGQIVTIGYVDNGDGLTYEELLEICEHEIEYINGELISDGIFGQTNEISIDDLCVEKIETTTSVNVQEIRINSIQLEGNYIEECITMDLNNPYRESYGESIAEFADHNSEIMPMALGKTYHITQNGSIGRYNSSTGLFTACTGVSATSPHKGDGNSRKENGYDWFPNKAEAKFETNTSTGKNRTTLYFIYDTASLASLKHDDNEALEMAVYFYADYLSEEYPGFNFQYIPQSGQTYLSNFPSAYLDTSFGDVSTITQLCVGSSDVSNFTANTKYFWSLETVAGTDSGRKYDGAFRVVAQRSYDSHNGLTVPYRIFSEEHESQLKLGLGAGKRWFSGDDSAWDYAASGKHWYFDASIDEVTAEGT